MIEISLPIGWVWRKARDCMDVRDGTHDSPKYIATGYPLVTSKNLVNGQIDFSTCSFISKEDFDAISKRSAVDDGDILYAMIGTIGNPVIVQKQSEFAIKNVALFKFNNQNISNRYVYHFLNSELAVKQFNSNSRGGTQKFVSLTNIRDLKIPLPPLAEQQKIAAILDAADSLRQKDQQLVERYTALSQSLFLEMFGDVFLNNKCFEITNLAKLIEFVQIGPFGSQLHQSDYVENGIPLINPVHIVDSKIVPNFSFTLTNEKYTSLPNYHLKTNDLIMARRGEMGRCALVTDNENGYFCGTGSLFIRPSNLVNPIFLLQVISSKSGREYLEQHSQGVTMMNLNKKIILNIEFGLPPIALQNQFAERIQLIEAQKQQAQRSLEKSEALFNGLLQRAFTGELTAKMAA